jgi:hypothetical protein
MNLKVEDLERETKTRNAQSSLEVDSLNNSSASINPQSFVLASMKEALLAASSVK